jgi:hypothetical protein
MLNQLIAAPATSGPIYSCNACPWSGNNPSCTNSSEVDDLTGVKKQFHNAICPVCFSFVAPESRYMVRR